MRIRLIRTLGWEPFLLRCCDWVLDNLVCGRCLRFRFGPGHWLSCKAVQW